MSCSLSLIPVWTGRIFLGSRALQRVRWLFHISFFTPHPTLRIVPLILKGVQCWEDALIAYDQGLAGVVLSNHGGRQLEFSRSAIEVLVEVTRELKARRGLTFPNEKFQLFVDGGVRRANDVLKAIALGATAVGVGRPFLYAFSSYGFEGMDHALNILNVSANIVSFCIGAGANGRIRVGRVRNEHAPAWCKEFERGRARDGRRIVDSLTYSRCSRR